MKFIITRVRCTPVVNRSLEHHLGDYTILARFHPNFEGEHQREGQGTPYFSSPSTNITIGFAVSRLIRVPSCRKGTMHLQTSISSSVFEPRPYGTAVSVANHYTGWSTY
ncbi:hypothetical protein TNCV_3855911 [Trichonephila clavipes]|nr:hypothetical protein TNCV_3855911 [Trichonephila clavipes]